MGKRHGTPGLMEAIAVFGTEPWLLLFNIIILLGSIIYVGVHPGGTEIYDTIQNGLVPALSCGLFIQIILQLFLLRENVGVLSSAILPKDTVVYPPMTVDNEIRDVLVGGKVASVQMICYGTNKFGKIIDFIEGNTPEIKLAVVICSPDCPEVPSDEDRSELMRIFDELSQTRNIEVIQSLTLPTVRAILIRDKRVRPIWASVQSYHFSRKRRGLKGHGITPLIVARDPDGVPIVSLSEYIQREFDRLAGRR